MVVEVAEELVGFGLWDVYGGWAVRGASDFVGQFGFHWLIVGWWLEGGDDVVLGKEGGWLLWDPEWIEGQGKLLVSFFTLEFLLHWDFAELHQKKKWLSLF